MNTNNNLNIIIHALFSAAILVFCAFVSTNPQFRDLIMAAIAALMAYWAPSPTQQNKAT
jgi:uncharacterized membrane protein YhfC